MSSQVSQTDEPVGQQAEAQAAPEADAGRARPGRPATDSIADGVGVRSGYAVALDVFEGPLDLLLHLVRRHELDILDIPIAFITEKYIEYISLARSLDIEVAGEYLLMAATLAFLKSRELLPVTPGEDDEDGELEDGVDPREELIRRLIEYERFRDAGFELANRPLSGRDVFPRGGDLSIEPPEPGLAPVTLFRLAEAYNRVLDRAKIHEDHEVVLEPITVRQRMQQLSLLLTSEGRIGFEELFLRQVWSSERELRQMLVVTLMSVLELVKLGVLGVHQAAGSDTIELERAVDAPEMDQVVASYHGDDEAPPPAEAAHAEVGPAEPEAAEAAHVEVGPAEPEAAEAAPVEPGPAQLAAGQAEPAAAEQPPQADPAQVEAASAPSPADADENSAAPGEGESD